MQLSSTLYSLATEHTGGHGVDRLNGRMKTEPVTHLVSRLYEGTQPLSLCPLRQITDNIPVNRFELTGYTRFMVKKILHEPLVHFVLAGALIFLVYALLEPEAGNDEQIIVDKAVVERLRAAWSRQSGRLPTPQEQDGMLADYLSEELFHREARSLGLEQDDPVIRRRLAQKMDLLAESVARQAQPSESELRDWYQAHPDLYRSDPRLGFRHIYFSPDRRGNRAEQDAAMLLNRLGGPDNHGGKPGPGDSFMLPHEFIEIGRSQLGRLFGEEFAATLFELEPGSWQGPVRSGYGYHLVYLFERKGAEPIPFAETRDRIMQDWQRDRYQQAKQELLEELKSRYEISYTEEAQALLNDG